MTIARVTVFGGSGFLGRYIVQRLARQGAIVRVAVRHPEEARFLQPMGDVGQIVPVRADLRDGDQVARALEGVDAAVNAVSLYIERGKTKFADIHETGARDLARAATAAGVERLVHISGIGADRDGRIAIDWGVYGVPETFIIDAEGRIRYKYVGPITPSDLDEIIVPIIEKLSK